MFYVTVNLCLSLVSGVPPLLFLGVHPWQYRSRVVHGLGWVQRLILCDGAFVLACWAAAEDILNIYLKSLFFSDIVTQLMIS